MPKLKIACKIKNCCIVIPQRVRIKIATGAKKTKLLKNADKNKISSADFFIHLIDSFIKVFI